MTATIRRPVDDVYTKRTKPQHKKKKKKKKSETDFSSDSDYNLFGDAFVGDIL